MARTYSLDIANTGNIPARFGLRVTDLRKSSQVAILLNNQALALQDLGALLDAEESAAAAAAAAARPAPAVRRVAVGARAGAPAAGMAKAGAAPAEEETPGTKITIDKPNLKGLAEKKEQVVKAAGVGVAITNTLSDVLMGLSAILPASIGRSLYSTGSAMRNATFVANRVDDAQAKLGQATAQAGELKAQADAAKKSAADAAKQAAELKGKAEGAKQAAGVAVSTAAPATGGAPRGAMVAVAEEAPAPVAPPKPARPSDFWALTPAIAPGDALTLTLRALPNTAVLASPYALTLESRPIELAAQSVPTTTDIISVTLGARTTLQFWLPWILTAFIGILVIALTLFLLNWAGLIRL